MISYLFYLFLYPILLVLSVFIGHKLAARQMKKGRSWKPLGLENGIVGFYALLISFTLIQSGNQAQERTNLIQIVTADISEVLRISSVYEKGVHERVRKYFGDFYQFVKQPIGTTKDEVEKQIGEIDKLDVEFDAYMLDYLAANPAEADRISSLISKTDRMESTYYRLMHSYHRQLPKMILWVLILFSMAISVLIGFISGTNQNRFWITGFIFIFISVLTVSIIHDLDNPSFGFIRPVFDDIEDVMHTYSIPI